MTVRIRDIGSDSVSFWVAGLPQPGGSKRAFPAGGRTVVVDANRKVGLWRKVVAGAARVAMAGRDPLRGFLAVTFEFVLPRPKYHYLCCGTLDPSAPAYPGVRPDTTKLIRAAEDACTKIVWLDDAQIVYQVGTKEYGGAPGVRITVHPVRSYTLTEARKTNGNGPRIDAAG